MENFRGVVRWAPQRVTNANTTTSNMTVKNKELSPKPSATTEDGREKRPAHRARKLRRKKTLAQKKLRRKKRIRRKTS